MVTYTCPDCDKEYEIYSSYHSHIVTHRPRVLYKCKKCGVDWDSKPKLFRHAYYCKGRNHRKPKPEVSEPEIGNKLMDYDMNLAGKAISKADVDSDRDSDMD